MIKVKYKSLVDLSIKTDYLRCNPKFNGHPRYNFVIANLPSPRGLTFAQLVFAFTCRISGGVHRLALIQRMEKQCRSATTRKIDKSLSIHRWTIQARSRCETIPLDCIVRGAVLLKDTEYASDYFVIDTLDEDMFLRVQQMWGTFLLLFQILSVTSRETPRILRNSRRHTDQNPYSHQNVKLLHVISSKQVPCNVLRLVQDRAVD